jgi:hypothetical protein
MKKRFEKTIVFWSITLFFIFLNINLIISLNNTLTVEANIIGFRNNVTYEGIGIQVTDSINLGDVTKNKSVSDEFKVDINNTGTVDITVTPQLADSNEGIFSYLFFRSHKTSNGTAVPFTRIGDYSIDINKPSTGSSVRKAYCYMILNLTDFNAPLSSDLIGHKAEVIFWAMPRA